MALSSAKMGFVSKKDRTLNTRQATTHMGASIVALTTAVVVILLALSTLVISADWARIIPFVLMSIACIGIALGEWLHRRRVLKK